MGNLINVRGMDEKQFKHVFVIHGKKKKTVTLIIIAALQKSIHIPIIHPNHQGIHSPRQHHQA